MNKAILTAGNPEGDLLWGLDNTLLSSAIASEVFEPYESPELPALDPSLVELVPGHEVTPVDTGDVCINIDIEWFASRGLDAAGDARRPRRTRTAGTDGRREPGDVLARLGVPARHRRPVRRRRLRAYWSTMRDNDVLVVDSWDAAYYDEFTAGGGEGDRPIVVSYASSPPATIVFAEEPKPESPTTASLDATCFRQVEFAGVLRGSDEVEAARQLLDFLVGADAQSELPLTNFVYPGTAGCGAPEVFERFAERVEDPLDGVACRHRRPPSEWVETWTRTVLG